MTRGEEIGLFICHCQGEKGREIKKEVLKLPKVIIKEYRDLCSKEGRKALKGALAAKELRGLVVLCSYPQKGDLYQLLEEGSPPFKLLKRGEGEIQRLQRALQELMDGESFPKEVKVTKKALVVGGGIGGIQAALDIAQAGFKVTLVEKSPSLGGRMAQLDKTFPTLDCSACILTPKMVDVAGHPNIELFTYAQLEEVTGGVGSFKVKIRKKARYVDASRCTGCGLCALECRLKDRIPSEFEEGIGKRGAIYLPFPQAVPSCYTIDAKHCLYLTRGKCGKEPKCVTTCDREAINFSQEDEIILDTFGSIVVATGYDPFPANEKVEYNYKDNPQVMTGLELERLLSASGPTGGKVLISTKEGNLIPKEVAFIQCVGSRDESVGNPYCSRVCCMYTAKQALLLMEKIPSVKVTVYYMDIRAFGKGFEEFYDQARSQGIHYIRGNPSEIFTKGEKMVVRAEDTLISQPLEKEYDLVVLAVGMIPRQEAKGLAQILGLPTSPDKFYQEHHLDFASMETIKAGIYLAGTCQGPQDIPDTIAQAKGAAAAAMIPLFHDVIHLYRDGEKTFFQGVKATKTGGFVHA